MNQTEQKKKQHIWHDMGVMLKEVKLPYLWLIVATVIMLGATQLALLLPSYLDVQSRRAVDQAIRNCAKEKTVILISHDMKAVEQADQILVLDQKHIVASGSHNSLMRQNSLYRQLQAAAE